MNVFLETERLLLRPWTQADFSHLASMLQHGQVMASWEHCFSEAEVQAWLERSLASYDGGGLGWRALVLKDSGAIVGQAALSPDVVNAVSCHEVSYMLRPSFWHRGYAREAVACLADYAFHALNLPYVIFEIRPENKASVRVAEAAGAQLVGSIIKPYRGKGMLHLVYRLLSPM